MGIFSITEVNFVSDGKSFTDSTWNETVITPFHAVKYCKDGFRTIAKFTDLPAPLHVQMKSKLKEGKTLKDLQDYKEKQGALFETVEGCVYSQAGWDEAEGVVLFEEQFDGAAANLAWVKALGESDLMGLFQETLEPFSVRFYGTVFEMDGYSFMQQSWGGPTFYVNNTIADVGDWTEEEREVGVKAFGPGGGFDIHEKAGNAFLTGIGMNKEKTQISWNYVVQSRQQFDDEVMVLGGPAIGTCLGEKWPNHKVKEFHLELCPAEAVKYPSALEQMKGFGPGRFAFTLMEHCVFYPENYNEIGFVNNIVIECPDFSEEDAATHVDKWRACWATEGAKASIIFASVAYTPDKKECTFNLLMKSWEAHETVYLPVIGDAMGCLFGEKWPNNKVKWAHHSLHASEAAAEEKITAINPTFGITDYSLHFHDIVWMYQRA